MRFRFYNLVCVNFSQMLILVRCYSLFEGSNSGRCVKFSLFLHTCMSNNFFENLDVKCSWKVKAANNICAHFFFYEKDMFALYKSYSKHHCVIVAKHCNTSKQLVLSKNNDDGLQNDSTYN